MDPSKGFFRVPCQRVRGKRIKKRGETESLRPERKGTSLETVLKRLLDFQAFSRNPELQEVIDSVHDRYEPRELSLDEMEMLNAAGTADAFYRKKHGKDS